MRRLGSALLITSLVLTGHALAHDEDPIEAALASPHATGLLVMGVVPDMQAAAAGFAEGDVLLTYDEKAVTDLAALASAKEAAAQKARIWCEVLRANGEEAKVGLLPGPLGLQLVPIEKGNPPAPLPADTGAAISATAAGEHDEWYSFSMGDGQVGLEHLSVRAEGEMLHFTHEVAFDGGEQMGLHHAVVRAVMRCGATVEPVTFSYENALNGWISHSEIVRNEDGRAVWHSAGGPAGEEPRVTEIPLRGDQSSLPSYAVAQIARLLPQEAGACFRFRPVADWDGKPGLRSAIVCVAAETITIGETEHATWKYEQRQLGGSVTGTYWFDAGRRMVKAGYGGPVTTLATKAEAMAGLNPELKLKTAGR